MSKQFQFHQLKALILCQIIKMYFDIHYNMNDAKLVRMILRRFNSPILFIHEIRWLCNLLPYHPISLHTLLSMILSNTRKNLQKNDFHALCVITIYSLYWLLKYRKDTLFVCYQGLKRKSRNSKMLSEDEIF